MNDALRSFARSTLKEGLAMLSEDHHRRFKLMYARNGGRRSVEDATAMPIDEVVDAMPDENLDWAMQQVENSLKKQGKLAQP
jgi:hypothetical protein